MQQREARNTGLVESLLQLVLTAAAVHHRFDEANEHRMQQRIELFVANTLEVCVSIHVQYQARIGVASVRCCGSCRRIGACLGTLRSNNDVGEPLHEADFAVTIDILCLRHTI